MGAMDEERTYTPEDLLSSRWKGYELVGGRPVEKNSGAYASWVGGRIACLIGPALQDFGRGWLLGADAGYQCFPDEPQKVRKPDLSFIRRSRLPGERLPKGHVLVRL